MERKPNNRIEKVFVVVVVAVVTLYMPRKTENRTTELKKFFVGIAVAVAVTMPQWNENRTNKKRYNQKVNCYLFQ